MITQWLIDMTLQVLSWVGSLFPAWDPPTQLTSMTQGVNDVLSGMAGFGTWVDFPTLTVCVLVQIATWVVVVLIALVRAVAAHIPLFGGAGD